MPRRASRTSTGVLLLRACLATAGFFLFARAWAMAIDRWWPHAGAPGGGAVILAAISTALVMLAVIWRAQRK